MINEENLRQMDDAFAANETIKTSDLNALGFNSKNLQILIEERRIIRLKRGHYIQGETDPEEQKYNRNLRLFHKYIHFNNQNFKKALKHFEALSETVDEDKIRDLDFYLYLLEMLTPLENDLRDYAENITAEQVLPVKEDEDSQREIRIRKAAFKGIFKYNLLKIQKDFRVSNPTAWEIEYSLLFYAARIKYKNRQHLVELINSEELEEAKKFIFESTNKNTRRQSDVYCLNLIGLYIEMKSSRTVPTPTITPTKDYYTAIDNKNFFRALELLTDYNQKCNTQNENIPLYLLLSKICTLIQELYSLENASASEEDKKILTDIQKELLSSEGLVLTEILSEEQILRLISLAGQYGMSTLTVTDETEAKCIAFKLYRQDDEEPNKQFLSDAARLGLSYLEQNRKDLAVKYLLIAKYIAAEFDKDTKALTELLENIQKHRQLESDATINGSAQLKQESLRVNRNSFNEVKQYIEETGLDVETACENLGLNRTQTDIIKLNFAREYFKHGQFKLGELFIRSVERSTDKSPVIKNLMVEINKNRKLYAKKGPDEGDTGISFMIMPNKKKNNN